MATSITLIRVTSGAARITATGPDGRRVSVGAPPFAAPARVKAGQTAAQLYRRELQDAEHRAVVRYWSEHGHGHDSIKRIAEAQGPGSGKWYVIEHTGGIK